jgi:anti-sigma factor RsiW
MTRHLDEDSLLRHSLGLLEQNAEAELMRHLEGCPACRGALSEVQRSIERMREVTPSVPVEIPPLPGVRPGRYRWLRMAAVFVVGIGTGVAVGDAVQTPAVTVVRQQIIPVSPSSDGAGSVPQDGIPAFRPAPR